MNLFVRVWECTEHNMEMMHIRAHLETMKHAAGSMLWTGNCLIVTLKSKFPSAVQSAPRCSVKFEDKSSICEQNELLFPKSQCTVSGHLLCNTWPDVLGFLKATLVLIWFDSLLMWISSATIESSHHKVVLTQARAMWLCELFLLFLWILHSPEWP